MQLSLEELMEATEKLELKTKSVPESHTQESEWTPLDRQMERITKMIEASTRELSSVQHHGRDWHSFLLNNGITIEVSTYSWTWL